MCIYAEDLRIFKRQGSDYYSFSLSGWPRGRRKSTYTTSRTQAMKVATAAIVREDQELSGATLREVAADYYLWDRCPHIRRLRDENKLISRLRAQSSRRALELYVFTDRIADLPFLDIKPGDCVDFRSRLRAQTGKSKGKLSPDRINRVITILHTVYQEEIARRGWIQVPYNPFDGLGKIHHDAARPGIFTREELASFFPPESLGQWADRCDYTSFLLAATAGMRRGEVLGLRRRSIDFIRRATRVQGSWHRGESELGEVKWGGRRTVPVPRRTIDALGDFRVDSAFARDEDLVFSDRDGCPLGGTWWRQRFIRFCKRRALTTSGGTSGRIVSATLLRPFSPKCFKIRDWIRPSSTSRSVGGPIVEPAKAPRTARTSSSMHKRLRSPNFWACPRSPSRSLPNHDFPRTHARL